MKPRTGPAWANEAIAHPTVSVPPTDNSTVQNVEQEPPQDDISDLEWMKQRISKTINVVEKAFEQSDDEGAPCNTTTLVKAFSVHFSNISHWPLLKIVITSCTIACRRTKGQYEGNDPPNLPVIRTEFGILMHRWGTCRPFQTLWRNLSGKVFLFFFILPGHSGTF